jgi:hypothetical protein
VTLNTFDFEGTQGATIAGTGITLAGTGTAIHDSAQAVVGGTGGKCTASDGLTRSARCAATTPSLTMAVSPYLRTPAATPSVDFSMGTIRNVTPGVSLRIIYTPAGAVGVQGVTGGFQSMATGVALNTMLRWELLMVAATSATGTITAKAYTSAAGWTTQLGSTFTSTTFDLGTAALAVCDVGALTAQTPGAVVGFDYVRMEDGRTTEFGAPPAVSGPTANAGADQYPEAGATVTLSASASTAGSGSITNYAWSTIEQPPGSASPSFTAPTAVSTDVVVASAGRYVFRVTVTQTGGLTATDDVTMWVHAAAGADIGVYSVTLGTFTSEGGATATVALNDLSDATWLQSQDNPAGQVLIVVLDPIGPGPVKHYPRDDSDGGAIASVTHTLYLENGTTVVDSWTYAPVASLTETELVVDSAGLALIPEGTLSTRRALVFKTAPQV